MFLFFLVLFSVSTSAFLCDVFGCNSPSIFLVGSDLNGLDDVVISNPQNNQLLTYFSGSWVNADINSIPDVNNAQFFQGLVPDDFWRIDGSSAPPTAGWSMGTQPFYFGSSDDSNMYYNGNDLVLGGGDDIHILPGSYVGVGNVPNSSALLTINETLSGGGAASFGVTTTGGLGLHFNLVSAGDYNGTAANPTIYGIENIPQLSADPSGNITWYPILTAPGIDSTVPLTQGNHTWNMHQIQFPVASGGVTGGDFKLNGIKIVRPDSSYGTGGDSYDYNAITADGNLVSLESVNSLGFCFIDGTCLRNDLSQLKNLNLDGNLTVDQNLSIGGIQVGGRQIFSAYNSSVSPDLDSTPLDVNLDTEWRNDSFFSHSTGTNNHEVTILAAGDYEVSFDCSIGVKNAITALTFNTGKCYLTKNGSEITGTSCRNNAFAIGVTNGCSSTSIQTFSVNDVISLEVVRTTGDLDIFVIAETGRLTMEWKE